MLPVPVGSASGEQGPDLQQPCRRNAFEIEPGKILMGFWALGTPGGQ